MDAVEAGVWAGAAAETVIAGGADWDGVARTRPGAGSCVMSGTGDFDGAGGSAARGTRRVTSVENRVNTLAMNRLTDDTSLDCRAAGALFAVPGDRVPAGSFRVGIMDAGISDSRISTRRADKERICCSEMPAVPVSGCDCEACGTVCRGDCCETCVVSAGWLLPVADVRIRFIALIMPVISAFN
jgi:hypothetical protein